MKKILLVLMLLTSVFIMAGCGKSSNPEISNPDGAYLTAKEGEFTYTITNKRMYDKLLKQVGQNILLDMIDKDLLKETKKDSTSYWDLVKDEDIMKELELDIFPNGTTGLTEDEITQKRADYYEQLFVNYGLNDLDAIKEYYHLELAKKQYAREFLVTKYDETDFTNSEYQTYFNNNYKPEYYTIVVTFDSTRLYQAAFEQLGYKIDATGTWVKISDSTALTDAEIVKAFIDLYNSQNAYKLKDYPTETLTLNQGVEYNVSNDVYTFDLEKIDMLHYTTTEMNAIDSSLSNRLKDDLKNYPKDTWYTNRPLSLKNGSMQTFVMKIGEITYNLDDKKAEIKDKLIESNLTNAYIQTKMAELRKTNGLEIFDNSIETAYMTTVKSYKVEYKEVRKTDKSIVAKTNLKSYSADDLFKEMNASYGMSIVIDELDYVRFITNTNLNTIYDYVNSDKKESERILNADRWEVIKQDVESEKKAFNDNTYEQYGYPKSYGWENYLKNVYGVSNELELTYYYLYTELRTQYSTKLGDLKGMAETSPLWHFYLRNMTKASDEYFDVKGVHLLITVYEGTSPLNPDKWSEIQIQYAKELYIDVMEYLKTGEASDYQKKLENLQNAFNKAPLFQAGKDQSSTSQTELTTASYVYEGIELSKYKTAGLRVKFEDLGRFQNGTMVKEFDQAVRTIWQANPTSTTPTVYGITPDTEGNYSYLVTAFGYHVYLNLASYELVGWEEDKFVPTLEQIQKYLANNDDAALTDEMIDAIERFYNPIYQELIGSNNLYTKLYSDYLNLDITLNHSDYTIESLKKLLNYKLNKFSEQLKYE